MDRIVIAKKITSGVVSFSVGRVITAIIRANVPQNTISDKIAVETASFAIGGMVAKAASAYTDETIDQIVTIFKGDHENATKS